MQFPKMFLARRRTEAPRVADIPGAILAELRKLNQKVRPGGRIAVTAGSRGIANNVLLLSTVVAELKRWGASPFLVPAMGSHGGATAEGQLKVLQALGVTEGSVGCPIISQMKVREIGRTEQGIPVFLDEVAAQADGIVVINRIKPHTAYKGDIESGLMKMMAVGLGKHQGALNAHKSAVQLGFGVVIPALGREVLRRAPILFGLGVVENAYDETARLVAVAPQNFEETERGLLQEAKLLLARLPFDRLDILIVEEMGKEISGVGMDSNVTGRFMSLGEPDPPSPSITRIVVLDLTEGSRGSAMGIGQADFTTRRLVDKIDYKVTYINSLTGMAPQKARLPVIAENDREAIQWAFLTIGAVEPAQARVVAIKNTLHLDRIHLSQALLPEIQDLPEWEIAEGPLEIRFDPRERLQLQPEK